MPAGSQIGKMIFLGGRLALAGLVNAAGIGQTESFHG
jgi:hypothetical protein